jgi:hypothetical protein
MKIINLKYLFIYLLVFVCFGKINAQSVSINTNTNNGIQVPSNFLGFSFDPTYYSQYFSTSYNSNNSRNITKQLFNNFYPFQQPGVRFLGSNGMYWKNGSFSTPTSWNYASASPYNYTCASCPTTSVASTLSFSSGDDINTGDLDNYKGFLDLLNYKPTTLFGISLAFLDPERAKDFSLTVKNKFTGFDYLFEIGNEPDAFVSNSRRTSSYSFTEYTNEFKLIKDAIIAANPNANIAGPAYAKTNNNSGTSWSPFIGTYIDNIGSSLKMVTMHDYPLGLDAASNNFNNYLSKYLSNNYSYDEVANGSTGLAPSINTSKSKNVPFRLAEANSIAGGGSQGISDAFGSALWAMDFMFELAKAGSTGIDIMTTGGSTTYYSPFTYSNSFVASGEKVRVNPIYYGMLFFANATQNNAKIMDITSQSSISEGTNNFKVWATKDANNTLRILVINRGTSLTDVSSKTITLTLPGAKMPGKKYDLLATGGSVTGSIGKTVVSGASFTIGGQSVSPMDGTLTGTATNTIINSVNETYTITLPAASASILEIPQNDCSVLTPATPTISTSSFTYCQKATTTGSISATATSGNSLQWYTVATGGTAATTTPAISTSNSGTINYYVAQRESTLGCESNRAFITVTINPLPTLTAITGTLSATVGNNSTLSNSTTGGVWTNADNTIATINTAGVVNALKAGTTTITYTYTNNNNCSNAVTALFTVTSNNNPTITAPIISAATSTTFCEGQNVVLSSNDANSIQWYKNGTAITNAISQTYTATSSGTFKVIKTSGTNTATSNEIMVTVNAIPAVPTISRDNNNNLVSNFAGTNSWYKDATLIPNENNSSYKPTSNGLYTIKANLNGCESNSSVPYYFVVTDIIHISANEYINIGPNPFKSNLSINYYVKSNITFNAKVFEISTGALVYQNNGLTTNTVLNLSNLFSGSYLLELVSNDLKKRYSFKLIKL